MSVGAGPGPVLVEAAGEAVRARAAAEGEQLAFLPTGINRETRKGQGLAELVERDRAGRPPGAQNKATREIRDLCRRLFGDPMLEDFRLAAHTPESLAQYLGCTKLEAARLLVEIRKDLRRYFYAPVAAVDGDGKPVTPIQMFVGGREVHVTGGAAPWSYLDPAPQEDEQNQDVTQSAPAVSHGSASHGEVK